MRVRGLAVWGVVYLCAVLGVLVSCAGSALAAAGGAGLIDGRGWELVSPADKHGAGINPLSFGLVQASEDGSAIAYLANAPVVADPMGETPRMPILSRRSAAGWSTQDLSTPTEGEVFGSNTGGYMWFSPDLSAGLLLPEGETPLPPLATGAENTLYVRNELTGAYLPLVTTANIPPGAKIGSATNPLRFEGSSPDLSHVVFSSFEALTENTVGGHIYEWAGGRLQLVSVLPRNGEGKEEPVGGSLGTIRRNAVSDDGSRIVWESESESGSHLYLRDMARGETVQLDSVQGGSGSGVASPRFQAASSDGSRVFFTDMQALTVDAKEGIGVSDGNLYVFEVSRGLGPLSGTLRDLTVDANAGETPGVLGTLPGASEDGSYVYFVAEGVLAPGAVHGDCGAHHEFSQSCNLYVEHYSGGAWEAPKLVAVLAGTDFVDGSGVLGAPATELTVRVSPDGRYLTFVSAKSLTGYDNRDAVSGVPDVEVYLYDAVAGSGGRVVCVSCDPTGARPTGVLYESNKHPLVSPPLDGLWVAASVPSWTPAPVEGSALSYQSRFLSDNGRVFFQSVGALVPGDVNGRNDVYESEPVGVGGCQAGMQGARVVFSVVADGCVGLVSSGVSPDESGFVDASAKGAPDAQGHEGGGDVFFVTSDRLAPGDVDGAFDMYDAHECTSVSPCLGTAGLSTQPCATADACRGALPAPGGFGTAASATLTGAGNLPPAVPAAVVKVKPKQKPLSRVQKLARALRVCHGKPRRRRAACEARARKAFGARKSRAVKATARSGR